MNWLITGGSGLVGKRLISLLDRNTPVTVVDIKEKPPILEGYDNLTWLQGDVTDFKAMEKVVDEQYIDGIVHLASLLRTECMNAPHTCINVNVGGFVNSLELASKKKLDKVIFISSVQVYGAEQDYGAGVWVDETSQRMPVSLYGYTKVHIEDYAEYYKQKHGVNVVGLRFSTVYGYGRSSGPNTYLTDCITKAAYLEDVDIPYMDYEQNLIYVKDAVGAVLHCMNDKVYKKAVYNICSDKLISNRDVAEALQELIPEIKVTLSGGKFPTAGATPYTSPKAAAEDLGFTLQYPVKIALADFIEEARTNKG